MTLDDARQHIGHSVVYRAGRGRRHHLRTGKRYKRWTTRFLRRRTRQDIRQEKGR